MKKFVLFFGCFLLAAMINAQAPQGFKYQTVARNNAGEILASQNISFRMTILQGSLPGIVVYAETHAATTNPTGLATLEIGRGTAVSGGFAAINWGTTPIFLKTEIDPAGGSAFVEMGTSELLSVPFSLYAKTAGNGFTHFVGELYGGGVVFHVYKDENGNEHGLIASITDLSTSAPWGLYGINVTNCESTWKGSANTNSILAAGCYTSDAAAICHTFTGGGFPDWYLPAIDELNLLYNSRFNVNKTLSTTPGATEIGQTWHWSSSEYNSYNAWSFYFYLGHDSNYEGKTNANFVRGVRAF